MRSTSDYANSSKNLCVTYFCYDMNKIIDELYWIEHQVEIMQTRIDLYKKKIQLATDDVNELTIRHNIMIETENYFVMKNSKNEVSISELITYFRNNYNIDYNIDGSNLSEWNAPLKSLIKERFEPLIKERFELGLIITKNTKDFLIHRLHYDSMKDLLSRLKWNYSSYINQFKIVQNKLNAKEKERKDIEFKIEKMKAQILKHKLKMEQSFIDNSISNLYI
jgi:hypothetical protein